MSLDYELHVKNTLNNWLLEDSFLLNNLLKYLKLDLENVFSIKAHSDVMLFENKGKPKTDLIIDINTYSGQNIKLTASIKKTKKKRSSFHEYPASEFIKVLNISDEKIIYLLNKHQNDGSSKFFTKEEKNLLFNFFKNEENKKKLYLWVLSGEGGRGQGLQNAQCIIKNDIFYSINDYIDLFLINKTCGFGTGFSWTRQSRGKGRTIQLKG